MRIRHADDWGRYAFSFFGIVDMLAIIPVWMISGVDLSAIRAIRLSRLLVTMTKLITRPHAAARLAMAFRTARDEAGVLFAWAGLATGISGVSMYFLERDAQPGGLRVRYSMASGGRRSPSRRSGYGDYYPVTPIGKVVACTRAPALAPWLLSLSKRKIERDPAISPEAPPLSRLSLVFGDSGPRRPFPPLPPGLSASFDFSFDLSLLARAIIDLLNPREGDRRTLSLPLPIGS